jgi:hypothetical protein
MQVDDSAFTTLATARQSHANVPKPACPLDYVALFLVAGGQFVSPSVIGLQPIEVGKTVVNIGENQEESLAVNASHKMELAERGGFEPPIRLLTV